MLNLDAPANVLFLDATRPPALWLRDPSLGGAVKLIRDGDGYRSIPTPDASPLPAVREPVTPCGGFCYLHFSY